MQAAERGLGYWNAVVDAHLNLPGQAQQNSQRAAPMNFAALDMLRRVEAGQKPAPEAYRIGQRWLVYSAAPLRLTDSSPVQGTLLLVVDLERLLGALAPLPDGVGQLQFTQQFGNAPAQTLASRGTQAEGTPIALNTGNPNWKLSFTPGAQLSDSGMSPILLAIAGLLALAGALVGLYLLRGSLQRKLLMDVVQLNQMVQELSSGKSVKAFSLRLSALDALAQSLARQSRRKSEPAAGGANGDRQPGPAVTPPRPR